MYEGQGALLLTLVTLGVASVSAGERRSVPVSPGQTDRFAPIADPCPTFSWSDLPGAEGYELVVYELPALGELTNPTPEALERLEVLEPAVRQSLPRTTAWTPDLDRCLERSKSYAWLVRAVAESPPTGEAARWSEPRFFTIGRREREPEPTPSAEPLPLSLDADRQRSSTSDAPLVAKPRYGAGTDDHQAYQGSVPEGVLAAWLSRPRPESVARVSSGAVSYPGPARIHATVSNPNGSAVGVRGVVTSDEPTFSLSAGLYGESSDPASGTGVIGVGSIWGVQGESDLQNPYGSGGVFYGYTGVRAVSTQADGYAGLFVNTGGGYLLAGCSQNVFPLCTSPPPPFYVEADGDLGAVTVFARTLSGSYAVRGQNQATEAFARGVLGESYSSSGRGVFGDALSTSGDTAGVVGRAASPDGVGGLFVNGAGDILRGLAGSNEVFRVENDGTVFADGAYNCGLSSGCFNAGQGADLAERIDPLEPLLPGEVVEVDPGSSGRFRKSRGPYSPRVVGVISDRAAITLNNNDLAGGREQVGSDLRPLVALAGMVPVRVSGEGGAIRPGDLLVASSTPGVAMRCARPRRCRGATIGKALEANDKGEGLVMMMVFPN
jgi:hypothetical protein